MMKLRKRTAGFTLMESVIAIGVVAILLTTFLAVFGPATQGIRRALSVQEADRLASALERELQILRTEDTDFDTAFEKAFTWIEESVNEDKAVFLYNYRGDPSSIDNGRMRAYKNDSDSPGEAGKDYVLQAGIRRQGDALLEEELEAVSGPVYYVNMVQLVFDGGKLTTGNPGEIRDPNGGGGGGSDAESYPEAVIAFNAEFYVLKSNAVKYVENFTITKDSDGRPKNLGRPLFSRNLAVRR